MRYSDVNVHHTRRYPSGFTLIELLVVISVISLLLAVLLPALNTAKRLTRRAVCQANLKQIAMAWLSYLEDSDGAFCQGINMNHLFGGWEGTGFGSLDRPLNRYAGLDPNIVTEDGARLFRCPSDSGGIFGLPPQELAYQYFGNSYQTNLFLIGPSATGPPSPRHMDLHSEINNRLRGLKLTAVSTTTTLLPLVGDNNWICEWNPLMPSSEHWHGKPFCHNLAFLDGHVDFIKVLKGLYVAPEYSVLPFRDLNKVAMTVQGESR